MVAATSGGRFSEKTEFHQSQNLAATLARQPQHSKLDSSHCFLLLITAELFWLQKWGSSGLNQDANTCEPFTRIWEKEPWVKLNFPGQMWFWVEQNSLSKFVVCVFVFLTQWCTPLS